MTVCQHRPTQAASRPVQSSSIPSRVMALAALANPPCAARRTRFTALLDQLTLCQLTGDSTPSARRGAPTTAKYA